MVLFRRLMEEAQAGDQGAGAGHGAGAQGDAGAAGSPGAAGAQGGAGDAAAQGAAGAQGGAGDAQKGYWPDDWVQRVSKGDEKLAKQLGRYASPEALAEAHINLRRRMDSGEFKTVLPENAKPEEVAAWRKDNGIPEKADGYDLKFDSGLVIGKDDKPVIDSFLERAHAQNMSPTQVKDAVEWYFGEQERQTQARAEKDDLERSAALDAIAQEWGTSARRNLNVIENVLSMFPEDVAKEIRAARLPSGTGLFNSVGVLKAFHALGAELNPASALVPGAGQDQPKAVNDRIKEIETFMNKDRAAYNKDDGMQKELLQLYQAREKFEGRKAA